MRDDLPADIVVDAFLYDDRDPTKVIAHVVLRHTQEDPPGFVAPVDDVRSMPTDPSFRKQLIGGDAPPLRTFLRPDRPPAVSLLMRGITFRISLEPWLSLDPDHTRVANGAMVTYRYDLFTEEHHQIMEADHWERRAQREERSSE